MNTSSAISLKTRLRLRLRSWVYFVWMLMIPIAFLMLPPDRTRSTANGLADARTETLATIENARIAAIEVVPGQHVRKGDILVRLNPTSTALDVNTQQIRMQGIEEDARRREQALVSRVADAKRNLKDTEVALAEAEMTRDHDRAALASYREEIQRIEPLIARKLLPATELAKIRPEAAALEQAMPRYDAFIAQITASKIAAEEALAAVTRELEDERAYATANVKTLEQTISAAIDPLKRGETSLLRASFDGVIAHIKAHAGDVVPGGEPIMRLTESTVNKVTVFLLPYQLANVSTGMPVTVLLRHRPTPIRYSAVLDSLEPEMLDLADPLNPIPSYPCRGRRAYLHVETPNALIPGEPVTVILPTPSLWTRFTRWCHSIRFQAGF